jgi:hypothetical protein
MDVFSLVGGILLMLLQVWADYRKEAPARRAKANAITKRDLDELESGMARVDGMQ